MNFEIRRDGAAAVVAMRGDIVASCVPELRPVLQELVQAGLRDMIMDMSETTMVDSTGIGLLLSAFNSMRKVDGKFAVVNVSDEILDLFRSLRFHQHFPVAGR